MSFTIALAGKGGTGKTTLAALMVRALVDEGAGRVLAVDADPNATLHEALGVTVERSVGEITEDMLASEAQRAGMPKDLWMEYSIQRYLVEERGYDLLSMGRPEGAGCYCYANNLIRGCVDQLSRGYDFVVMDNEAGLEHLSRRTTRDVGALVLVSDESVRGVRTAARIGQLADELGITIGSRHLVINRGGPELDAVLKDEVASTGLDLLGVVPLDGAVTRADLDDTGLLGIPADAPAVAAARAMVEELVLAGRGVAG